MSFVKLPPRLGIQVDLKSSDLVGFDTAVTDLTASLGVVSDIRVELGATEEDTFALLGQSLDLSTEDVPFLPPLLEEGNRSPVARASLVLDSEGNPVDVSNGPTLLASSGAGTRKAQMRSILTLFEFADPARALRELENFARYQSLSGLPVREVKALHAAFVQKTLGRDETAKVALVLGQIARLNPDMFERSELEAIDAKAGTTLAVEIDLMKSFGIKRAGFADPRLPEAFIKEGRLPYAVINDSRYAGYNLYFYETKDGGPNGAFIQSLMRATGDTEYDHGVIVLGREPVPSADGSGARTVSIYTAMHNKTMMIVVGPLMGEALKTTTRPGGITYTYTNPSATGQ